MGQTIAEEIWEEGKATGELGASRRILRKCLTTRFGPLPEEVVQRIERCIDLERLEVAIDQLSNLVRLEDLSL